MFSRRLLFAASVLAAASHLAQACIQIIGNNDAGLGDRQNLQMLDNGVKVCDGHGSGGGGTITCNDGYSLSYHDATVNGPFPVHYCDPGACVDANVDQSCEPLNCCGGDIPCTCWMCALSYNDGINC